MILVFCGILFVLLGLSFVAQEFLPSVSWAYQSRLFIVPVVFLASAVAVPFPVMLAFAFFTGLIWDARHLTIWTSLPDESVYGVAHQQMANPHFGFSIVLYGLMGSLMQGIRPLFRRGRYELPVLMTGVATGLLLTIEYLFISFLRGSFDFSRDMWFNIGTTSMLAMMISPAMFLIIHWLSRLSGYQMRFDGLKSRRSW